MSKIKKALDVVNDLRSLADSIEVLVDVIDSNQTELASLDVAAVAKKKTKVKKDVEAKKEPPKKESEKKEKPHTLEEVRAVLASLSQAGKQAQVKSLITSFGAKKLSDIPDTQYPEVLEKASEL